MVKIQLQLTLTNTSQNPQIVSQEQWETIFPYSKLSAVFTHDNRPFWTLEDFLESVNFINNMKFKGFLQSDDTLTNTLELASFLANFHQETGDPSLQAPVPWLQKTSGLNHEGPAGGALAILEGVVPSIFFGEYTGPKAELQSTQKLSSLEKKILGTDEDTITGVILNLKPVDQPQFGLGQGTGGGVVFQDGLYAVSDDGTLYTNDILPKPSISDRRHACLGPYCQYGGRGAIQLSYNYNYTECSKDLFGDLRLVRYPNLIITTDRESFNGKPYFFGFPGPNPGGNNKLSQDILTSTPPARQMAWIVCLWFWMTNRSGRKISCHDCMTMYTTHGITGCNMIINNQSGEGNTWATKKLEYYRRICKIFGISKDIVEKSIILPPHEQTLRA